MPTDPEWAKTLKPGWQKERQRNFHTAAFEAFAPASRTSSATAGPRSAAIWPRSPGRHRRLGRETDPAILEEEDYMAMQRLRDRVDDDRRRPGDGGGAEAVLPLPVQAAVLQRRVPADLQPPQCHPGRRVGHQGRRAHHREGHHRRRRRARGRLHHLRQRLRDHHRDRSPLGIEPSPAVTACRSTTTGATATALCTES